MNERGSKNTYPIQSIQLSQNPIVLSKNTYLIQSSQLSQNQ